jgi:hypothetical protein
MVSPGQFQHPEAGQFGNQPVQIGAGVRYWLMSPDSGPKGLGGRLTVTFLFPKK